MDRPGAPTVHSGGHGGQSRGSLRPRADGRPCKPRVSTCGPASGCEGTLLSVPWVATHPSLVPELGRERTAGPLGPGAEGWPRVPIPTWPQVLMRGWLTPPHCRPPSPRPQGSPRSCNTLTTLAKQVQPSSAFRNQELGQRTWVSKMAWHPWAHILCGNGGRADSGSPTRVPPPSPRGLPGPWGPGACPGPAQPPAAALGCPELPSLPWLLLLVFTRQGHPASWLPGTPPNQELAAPCNGDAPGLSEACQLCQAVLRTVGLDQASPAPSVTAADPCLVVRRGRKGLLQGRKSDQRGGGTSSWGRQ